MFHPRAIITVGLCGLSYADKMGRAIPTNKSIALFRRKPRKRTAKKLRMIWGANRTMCAFPIRPQFGFKIEFEDLIEPDIF